jgi:UDP-N-acetylmuramate: L-alanyl-gamma-D-glutamyl-meso-diaminopimelate ligase
LKNIHVIAACGVGMASLAGMLQEKGFRVTGSDNDVYPPMSTQLEKLGIRLSSPYKEGNIPADAELVVVGNAVSRDNPECLEAVRRNLPMLSMPQALADYFIEGRESIVVAGTHGKTTTTSLAAWTLFALGDDPSFLVGGVPRNFPVSYRVGAGPRFVVEGDEYDTAYFDKGPKFLHYRPKTVLLTSVEFDHADIYRDLEHLKESFRRLARIIPADGLLVACADYPAVVEVAAEARCPVAWYATGDPAPGLPAGAVVHRVGELREVDGESRFGIEGFEPGFRLRLPGMHNAANAAAVAIALCRAGFPADRVADAMAGFEGVRRRQEVVGEFGGVLVVDDFAHHPTAVRETIRAVRGRWPGRPVTAVFEPRSNTSRRNVFQKEFAEALAEADSVVVAGVFGAGKIPEAERMSPEQLADSVKALGREASFVATVDEIVEHVAANSASGTLVLVMSNGGFGGIQQKLARRLDPSLT